MNKKAVIYARVSSESDRQSTTRQVDDLRAYAYRNDLELVKVFEEKASGAKDDRPVLAECVKFCLAGNAETLLVTELSRLGRTVKIIVNTLDDLTKAKVNVHIHDINLDTLQPSGEENPLASIIGSRHGTGRCNRTQEHRRPPCQWPGACQNEGSSLR